MTTRVKIRIIAIALSLGYTFVRVLLVQVSLKEYGVDPWLFLLIDAVTGVTYVLGIEQLVVAIRSKRQRNWKVLICWALLVTLSFALPYLYLFIFSRELPLSFAIGIGLIVALLLANAVLSLVRRVRAN